MDDFMHWLSVDIFGEDVVDNTNFSQYYPQNNAPYYP
jgi:tricorn protease-like protein